MQVGMMVQPYLKGEVVLFDQVLSISAYDRIPNLTHVYGIQQIHAIVSALLAGFCNAFNVVRPMNPDQIVECAYQLVLTSQEDQLSIQDYVLFFRGARQGKYGRIMDRLDEPTIFDMLEQYRQQRHSVCKRMRDERQTNHSASGPTERVSEDGEQIRDLMHKAHLQYYGGKVQKTGEDKIAGNE